MILIKLTVLDVGIFFLTIHGKILFYFDSSTELEKFLDVDFLRYSRCRRGVSDDLLHWKTELLG